MSRKKILILNGHPAPSSLSSLFAETYAEAAQGAGHDVRLTHLPDMAFDPDHETGGYATTKQREPVLETFLDDLDWCGHFVLCSPMWWGGLPAKLKGVFDRAFIPGRTFSTRETTPLGLPNPLLTGRSARVIITADTPGYFMRFAYGNALQKQLKNQILGFCGFKPVRFSWLAPASDPTPDQLTKWKAQIATHGAKGD